MAGEAGVRPRVFWDGAWCVKALRGVCSHRTWEQARDCAYKTGKYDLNYRPCWHWVGPAAEYPGFFKTILTCGDLNV
jgi:hypothetical protein